MKSFQQAVFMRVSEGMRFWLYHLFRWGKCLKIRRSFPDFSPLNPLENVEDIPGDNRAVRFHRYHPKTLFSRPSSPHNLITSPPHHFPTTLSGDLVVWRHSGRQSPLFTFAFFLFLFIIFKEDRSRPVRRVGSYGDPGDFIAFFPFPLSIR